MNNESISAIYFKNIENFFSVIVSLGIVRASFDPNTVSYNDLQEVQSKFIVFSKRIIMNLEKSFKMEMATFSFNEEIGWIKNNLELVTPDKNYQPLWEDAKQKIDKISDFIDFLRDDLLKNQLTQEEFKKVKKAVNLAGYQIDSL